QTTLYRLLGILTKRMRGEWSLDLPLHNVIVVALLSVAEEVLIGRRPVLVNDIKHNLSRCGLTVTSDTRQAGMQLLINPPFDNTDNSRQNTGILWFIWGIVGRLPERGLGVIQWRGIVGSRRKCEDTISGWLTSLL